MSVRHGYGVDACREGFLPSMDEPTELSSLGWSHRTAESNGPILEIRLC